MIDEKVANTLNLQLQRIFCLPITRSTFRELQNVILTIANNDQDTANKYFETLLRGQIDDATVSQEAQPIMTRIIDRFTIPARMSKEVFERGDFVAGMTSETISQTNSGEKAVILTRVRKVDGEELQFINTPQSVILSITHLLQRLEELKKLDKGSEVLSESKTQINDLKTRIASFSEGIS